jgi:hypothetical protein
MLTRLKPGERGSLRVMETDMKSLPIVFVDTVKRAIRDLRAQKDSGNSMLPADDDLFAAMQQRVCVGHVGHVTGRADHAVH